MLVCLQSAIASSCSTAARRVERREANDIDEDERQEQEPAALKDARKVVAATPGEA